MADFSAEVQVFVIHYPLLVYDDFSLHKLFTSATIKLMMLLRRLIVFLAIIVVIVGGIAIGIKVYNDHQTLVPEKGFEYVPPAVAKCSNTSPACGNCYGKIVGQTCYVKPSSPYATH